MHRLRTLGGLSIDGTLRAPTGAAAQRRRLALLALLAGAGAQGMSREKLLGFLWTERDEDRAKHALSQSLYALRRSLGEDELFLGSTELRLNPSCVEVDLWEFQRAGASRELELAAELYGGPFLDGFYLDEAPEFERWVETERSRHKQQHLRTLETLATAADAAGDTARSVEWRRKLVASDPLSARATLGLMRALIGSGDSPAALQHARYHESQLRSELDAAPAPEVLALVDQLRADCGDNAHASAAVSSAAITSASSDDAGARPPLRWARKATRRFSRASASMALGLLVAVAVIMAAPGFMAHSRVPDQRLDENRIAVFPFAVQGDTASAYLGAGMSDILGAALDGAGAIRAVDARALLAKIGRGAVAIVDSAGDPQRVARTAAEFGASFFVTGVVNDVNGQLQVNASLYDSRNAREPLAHATSTAERTKVFAIVGDVAEQLLAARFHVPSARLSRVAALTTHSLPALKAYLNGERALRAWDFAPALENFQRAVTLDSAFALGWYRLSIAADWMGRDDLIDSAAATAVRYQGRLSAHDKLLVQALLAWRRKDADGAERRYREILLRYPDDVETWYQLGEVLFHDNAARGRSFVEARLPFERALALEPKSQDTELHLLRIDAWENRWDSVAARLRRTEPQSINVHMAPYRALASHDARALEAALDALRPVDANSLTMSAIRLAIYVRDPDAGLRTAALLVDSRRLPNERAVGHRLLSLLATARGQYVVARAHADSMRQLSGEYGLDLQGTLALLPISPYDDRDKKKLLGELLSMRVNPVARGAPVRFPISYSREEMPLRRVAQAGLLAARAGDSALALSLAAELEKARGGPRELADWPRARARVLRAAVHLSRRQLPQALEAITSLRGLDAYRYDDDERFLLATILQENGRTEEAARWFGSFEQLGVEALAWAPSAHLRRAEQFERLGRSADAASEYDRFVELWADCDAELRPLVIKARARARQLHP